MLHITLLPLLEPGWLAGSDGCGGRAMVRASWLRSCSYRSVQESGREICISLARWCQSHAILPSKAREMLRVDGRLPVPSPIRLSPIHHHHHHHLQYSAVHQIRSNPTHSHPVPPSSIPNQDNYTTPTIVRIATPPIVTSIDTKTPIPSHTVQYSNCVHSSPPMTPTPTPIVGLDYPRRAPVGHSLTRSGNEGMERLRCRLQPTMMMQVRHVSVWRSPAPAPACCVRDWGGRRQRGWWRADWLTG